MFLAVIFVVGLFGHLSNGVPLEDPSADYKQFFDSRIVGGTDADEGKSPHMGALVVGYTWQSFVCGSSIISKNHILTAAHCVTSFIQWDGEIFSTFHAIVGSNTWHKGTIVEFKSYGIHPEYDSWFITNDIAWLETKHRIQLNDRVAVIALNYDFVGGGVKSFVTGWGTDALWGIVPDQLQILHVKTMSHEECHVRIQEAAPEWGGWAPPVDPKSQMCTFHSPGYGNCHGDSGSALVSYGKQIGIVSWGLPCARGAPDVYCSIHGANDFMKSEHGPRDL